jgi:hypothetical protein
MNQDKFKQLQVMYSELNKLEDQRLLIFKTIQSSRNYSNYKIVASNNFDEDTSIFEIPKWLYENILHKFMENIDGNITSKENKIKEQL